MDLNNQQLRVLSALADKGNPLSRRSIADRCFNGNQVNFAPILDPMVAGGYISRDDLDIDGKIETNFCITRFGASVIERVGRSIPVGRTSRTKDETEYPVVGEYFVKEYKGETFIVEVVPEGFSILGHIFTSLTAAAKYIRGSQQEVSGPAFFGFK